MATNADFIVIGGGIAGASAAYHLAPFGSVVLLEREPQLAYHTTGRSAAIFTENYGGRINQMLTAGSRAFLESRGDGLADAELLTPIGMLTVGGEESVGRLHKSADRLVDLVPSVRLVDEDRVRSLVPCIRSGAIAVGLWEPDAAELDVMGLHQAFVRGARRAGAHIQRSSNIIELSRHNAFWMAATSETRWRAPIVINAAGAWGDVIADIAGVGRLGLQPMRRTAFTVAIQDDVSGWPFISFENPGQQCYFKPEAGGQLLCSPADETPTEPCDARPEEIDIARAIESINSLTTLGIRSIRSSWAGLRTFTPDRNPAIGWATDAEGLCWMVGQGGTGIQTAPASGAVVASVVTDSVFPEYLTELGIRPEDLAPRG